MSAPTAALPEYSAPTAGTPAAGAAEYSAPTATAAAAGVAEYSAPSAAAASRAVGEYSAPSATAATAGVAEYEEPTGGTFATVTGTLSPNAIGDLIQVSTLDPSWVPGESAWSTDGATNAPVSGQWVRLHASMLATAETKTLDEIWPVEFGTATDSSTTASRITILNTNGTFNSYWLYLHGSGPRWVLTGDATLSNAGGTSIAANLGIWIYSAGTTLVHDSGGGLYEVWLASPTRQIYWALSHFTNGATGRFWRGRGQTPETATFAAISPATGVPSVALTPTTAPPLPIIS